jgi:hypothetical protein
MSPSRSAGQDTLWQEPRSATASATAADHAAATAARPIGRVIMKHLQDTLVRRAMLLEGDRQERISGDVFIAREKR